MKFGPSHFQRQMLWGCILPICRLPAVKICFSPFSAPPAPSPPWIATIHFTPRLYLHPSYLLGCGVCSASLWIFFWVIYINVSVIFFISRTRQARVLLLHHLPRQTKMRISGAPGWLSQLSVWLRLRSWSHNSWVRAPRQALCWQLRAWSLLQILSPSLSAPPPLMCRLSLSLSQKYFLSSQSPL